MTPRELKDYYRSLEFKSTYHYEGELGAAIKENKTIFRLWSPLSTEVTLRLYKTGEGRTRFTSLPMKRMEKGVWEAGVEEDLHGTYYDFLLESKLGGIVSADPYARACGVNGKRSMVVDLGRTNPVGWEEDKPPKKEAEDIIYELHVKEFSFDEGGGFKKENRGRYSAFKENVPHKGLNYIRELGVNYIQLLPVFDFASVEERDPEAFNWGYDPLNYNVPEGSYSSDPEDGSVRIREMKEMIKSIHEKGMRVIMDVVYNHTYSLDSWFQRTVPWYFYRIDDSGEVSDGSACGNDFATEMDMAAKYILDSVLYWAKEYHIDGFRFDLMGLIGVKLMNKIRKALDDEFGEGEKLIYGEPWAADISFPEEEEVLASKKNLPLLADGIGIFSDDIRDGIKGSVFYEAMKGFANGDLGFTENIVRAITAFRGEGSSDFVRNATGEDGYSLLPKPKSPKQIINYVSCHDNQTLWDKLSKTTEDEEKRLREYRLAASIYLMCQGRCFLYSGEEFLRTKNGEHNTYNASVHLNKLDWSLVTKNKEMVDFYKGLIALRKEFPGLSDKSEKAFHHIKFLKVEPGFIVFLVKHEEKEGKAPKWKDSVILFNATGDQKEAYLPDGDYQILSDGIDSLSWKYGEEKLISKEIEVPPYSAYILGFKRSW